MNGKRLTVRKGKVDLMRSSWKKLLVLLLVLVIVVAGSVCFVLSRKNPCLYPFSMWLEVTDESILNCPEHIRLKYAGCSVEPSSTEEEQVTLQIECTLTERTEDWPGGFTVLYQGVEDSGWHIIFIQGYADQLVYMEDTPGVKTIECTVPRRLFYHRGTYKIRLTDRGNCDLPREKVWNGPDDECGQLSGIHTESGFAMYRDSVFAGSAEDYSDEGLVKSEVIQGDDADILKLTVEVQKDTRIDKGFIWIFFCPPNGDKLRQVYCPVTFTSFDYSQPANDSNTEIAPGLNTVEYPVPKGLFQHDGDYYISCSVGRYKLFEN